MPASNGKLTTKQRGYGYDYERMARVLRRAALGHSCPRCGVLMGVGKRNPAGVTVDHILPLVLGGTNTPENLVAICRRCNSRGGAALSNVRQANRRARRRPRVPGGVFGPLSS